MKLSLSGDRCNLCGAQVRQRRKELHLSQEALAARLQLMGLEIQQKAISRMETGERIVPDYELPLLAAALETDIVTLLQTIC